MSVRLAFTFTNVSLTSSGNSTSLSGIFYDLTYWQSSCRSLIGGIPSLGSTTICASEKNPRAGLWPTFLNVYFKDKCAPFASHVKGPAISTFTETQGRSESSKLLWARVTDLVAAL